jgi:hypothetical protein
MESTSMDWEWINQLPALAIFEATAISLGYALDSLPPVGRVSNNQSNTAPPETYRERTILAYEYARNGELATRETTSERGALFDKNAEFDEGQFWNVSPALFREFCDRMGWEAPAKFLPKGYVLQAVTHVAAAVALGGNGTIWTTEKKALARTMMNELRAQGIKAFAKNTAAEFEVSAARLRYVLKDKPKKANKKANGVWGV